MNHTDYTAKALANRLRRQKQLKLNTAVLAVSVFMVIVLSVLFLSFSTEANDFEHRSSYKYYKSIEISKGDTLWSIANENFDPEHYSSAYEYINEVKKMNSLTSDTIVAGSHIIVPYYASEFVSAASD